MTDHAYDSEVSGYFRDSDSPPPPTSFYYGPSTSHAISPIASLHPRADSRMSRTSYRSVSRQQRAASRQSRQSMHSQVIDPMVDLMNRMFDKVASDAVIQRTDMQAEMARREREAADKARLQLENELMRKEIATEKG